MAKDTPSIAKNKIRRSLLAIYDPYPSKSETKLLWEYFESNCAYCNILIDPSSRTGHLDHLISSTEGGTNNIHNFVLACARCNGDEKREESWVSFLERKSDSVLTNIERKEKIESWAARAPVSELSSEFSAELAGIIKEALDNFDESVTKVRDLSKRIK